MARENTWRIASIVLDGLVLILAAGALGLAAGRPAPETVPRAMS